jgi:RNA polymerase sigma-70 factor (ECF subfamily)
MFNNTNDYKLRTEIIDDVTHYYVSFRDGQNILQETEVSRSVYKEFQRFIKTERNLRRWDERHREYSELTDETLYSRVQDPPMGIEDDILDNLRYEQLLLVIRQLSEKQQRRFMLYYEYKLTYEQIAKLERCTNQAVAKSIELAQTAIIEYFKNN